MIVYSRNTLCLYTILTIVSMVFFIGPNSYAQISRNNFSHFSTNSLSGADTLNFNNDSLSFNTDSNYLSDSTKKYYVFRQLYGLVSRKDRLKNSGKIIKEFESSERFVKYADKQIQEIRIIRLKTFGQSINDTTIIPTSLAEKFGNSLHITTLKKVIENNILFNVGDRLNPLDFSETEQLLRELSYIEDANIIVETLPDTNMVRAIVVTKDKWTLSLGLRIDNLDKGKAIISESNFAGVGLGASASGFYDNSKADNWGYMGEFKVPNIAGSFIDANLWIREGVGYNSYYTNFNRDFYSSQAKFAGGFTYFLSKEPYRIYAKDSLISIDYNLFDFWIGRSFRLSSKKSIKAPYSLTLAFKYKKIDFDKADSISIDYNPYFHSTNHYLVSLGLSNQNLFQSNLIYSFGSTEDIPVGFKVQFASGIEESQYQRRFLINGEMSAAEITPLGYLYLSVRTSGYLAEGQKLEQAVINIRSTYITNIFSVGKADLRQFIRYDFTRGFSRFAGEKEYIALRNEYGIRGLKSSSLTGTTRLMVNLETVVFSPLYIYGFRFAYYAFCDIGAVGSSDDLVYSNSVYSGFGLGLRIRNESLIFPTFVFRLGYYPNLPKDAEVAYWFISSESRRNFEKFRIKEPYILPYE